MSDDFKPLELTERDVEDLRIGLIAAHKTESDTDWLADLKMMAEPKTFGYHEALHTASIYMDSVESHVMSHPAILMDKEAFTMAHTAYLSLFNLYNYLGSKHLSEEIDDDADE